MPSRPALTAGASIARVRVARCPPGGPALPGLTGTAAGGQARLFEPHSLGALGNSLLQSNSPPACMCAFVRNVHEVRVPHARTLLGFPTL